MARITGIGGVFFKSRKDSTALATWYQKHLGMLLEDFGGAILRWPQDKAEDKGITVWHIAEKESQWFSPSDSPFMINYRVDNLDEMIAQLRSLERGYRTVSWMAGSCRYRWDRSTEAVVADVTERGSSGINPE